MLNTAKPGQTTDRDVNDLAIHVHFAKGQY